MSYVDIPIRSTDDANTHADVNQLQENIRVLKAALDAIYRLGSAIKFERTYTAISATNPWFCLSLPDQDWTTAHFSAEFIAEMRTRKVIYDEMGASPVSSFGGA